MSDICEALATLLQDVVLPDVEARDGDDVNSTRNSSSGRVLNASVVKSAIRTLLKHRRPGT